MENKSLNQNLMGEFGRAVYQLLLCKFSKKKQSCLSGALLEQENELHDFWGLPLAFGVCKVLGE